MNAELKNKTVLVTGASGGIGQALVRAFANEGAKVAVHYNRNKDSAEALLTQIPFETGGIFQADLRDELEVANLWKAIESKMGPVEILIANAAIYYSTDCSIQDMSVSQWEDTLRTNLTSVFLCFREFFRGIVRNKIEAPAGLIMGSTAGIFGEAFHSDYATSKSGLIYGFMLSLKNELIHIAKHGRVNAVCPTWTLTPMAEEFSSNSKAVRKHLQTIPLRKFVRPKDVANVCVFLSSQNLSGHISGQMIPVSGGMEGRVLFDPDEIDLNCI